MNFTACWVVANHKKIYKYFTSENGSEGVRDKVKIIGEWVLMKKEQIEISNLHICYSTSEQTKSA